MLHIDWKKGIESMLSFNPARLYFVLQEQSDEAHAVAKGRALTPSIKEFAGIANPTLIPRRELVAYLGERGYDNIKTYEKPVPDNKTMVGLIFANK